MNMQMTCASEVQLLDRRSLLPLFLSPHHICLMLLHVRWFKHEYSNKQTMCYIKIYWSHVILTRDSSSCDPSSSLLCFAASLATCPCWSTWVTTSCWRIQLDSELIPLLDLQAARCVLTVTVDSRCARYPYWCLCKCCDHKMSLNVVYRKI